MTLSVTTLIVFTALLLGLGVVLGFALGVVGRLFFRYSFTVYCRQQQAEANKHIAAQYDSAMAQTKEAIANAHAEVAHVYKAAAEHSAKVGLVPTDVTKKPN